MTIRDAPTLKSYFNNGDVPTEQNYVDLIDTIFDPFSVGDGWVNPGETWTWVNATTFLVAGNLTARYAIGVKVKFTQGTVKYGYVKQSIYSAPNTIVILVTNNDYSIANATITDTRFSFDNPPDFPEWFSYTPTWTSSGTAPTLGNAVIGGRFKIRGRECTIVFVFIYGSTSSPGTGTWAFGLPIVSANPSGGFAYQWIGMAHTRKSGATNYESVIAVLQNRTDISQFTDPDWTTNVNNYGVGVPFTWAGGDSIRYSVSYEI